MSKRIWLPAVVGFLWIGTVLAFLNMPKDIIKIDTGKKVSVKRGKSTIAKIIITIKHGYHINAHKVKDDFLIPTVFTVKPSNGLKIGTLQYPESKMFSFKGHKDTMWVYEETLLVQVPLTASKKAKPGNYQLQAALNYQACDSISCLMPQTLPVTIPIRVKK